MAWFDKKNRKRFVNPKIHTRTFKEKENNINFNYLWIFIIIIIIIIMLWWMGFSEYFNIKNILVEGTVNEEIRTEIDKFYNQNILKFTIGQKDKELAKKQSSIESIEIIKGIPDTLKIDVKVREPQIRWKSNDKTYYIDKNGIVFELAEDVEKYDQLPIVEDSRNLDVISGKKLVASEFVDFIALLNQKMNEEIKYEIDKITIDETTLYVTVYIKDKFKVYFDTTNNINKQIYILKKIIENHQNEIKEYVDLRIPSKAYYK